jgi:hypothetical protein
MNSQKPFIRNWHLKSFTPKQDQTESDYMNMKQMGYDPNWKSRDFSNAQQMLKQNNAKSTNSLA